MMPQIVCTNYIGDNNDATGFVTRLTRCMPLVEQFTPDFQWGSCYSIFSFMCMFCRSLFVILFFFFWPLCCLSFFDLRILITSLWYLQTLLTICGEHFIAQCDIASFAMCTIYGYCYSSTFSLTFALCEIKTCYVTYHLWS